jgi:hypothetical protein
MPALLPDSKILEQAGRILAVWGYIEFQTKLLLQQLLDIDFTKADLIYGSFVSFDSKLSLCNRLNIVVNPKPEFQEVINAIIGKLRPLNDERNTIAHSLYGSNPTTWTPYFMVNYLPKNEGKIDHGKNQDITVEKMTDRCKEFEEVSSEFEELLNHLCIDNPT